MNRDELIERIRRCRYNDTLNRLTEFITLSENLDVYLEFQEDYESETDRLVYPVEWLMEDMDFPFTDYGLSMLDLIRLGQHSPKFNPDDKYCWYDPDKGLFSTNTPFADGLIDAKALARWILEKPLRIQRIRNGYMINTDIDYVFRNWRS